MSPNRKDAPSLQSRLFLVQLIVKTISNPKFDMRSHLRVIFGEYSDFVENGMLTMQRSEDVSRFLYSEGWQVWGKHVKHDFLFLFYSSTLHPTVIHSPLR